jgi:hypothetical protein
MRPPRKHSVLKLSSLLLRPGTRNCLSGWSSEPATARRILLVPACKIWKTTNSGKSHTSTLIDREPSTISDIKDIVEVFVSLSTFLALIVAGIWSYLLFIRTRQKYPSANISQEITYRRIARDKVWLRVTTTLQNTGNVLLSLVYGRTWIQQVRPLDEGIREKILHGQDPVQTKDTEIEWPLLSDKEISWEERELEIEPNESDQIHFDFILDSDVKTIVAYSYFRNAKKYRRQKELGWQITRVYDLQSLIQRTSD